MIYWFEYPWVASYAVATVFPIFSEHKVQIPELNVIGTLDIAVYNAETEVLEIYDVKTAAAFTWSKHFGRKENRQENANQNYKLQHSPTFHLI